MRSITTALGAAVLGAGIALAVPAAYAAPAQQTGGTACASAVTAADTAETAYQAALTDYRAIVSGGGHPDASQQDNVTQLASAANASASFAARVCPDAAMPSGTMQTGVGSTSEGTGPADITAGIALIAVVCVAAAVLRRRQAAGRS